MNWVFISWVSFPLEPYYLGSVSGPPDFWKLPCLTYDDRTIILEILIEKHLLLDELKS